VEAHRLSLQSHDPDYGGPPTAHHGAAQVDECRRRRHSEGDAVPDERPQQPQDARPCRDAVQLLLWRSAAEVCQVKGFLHG